MRALVLGSEGTIGRPLVGWLRERGHDVFESDIRPGWRDAYLPADIACAADLLPALDWQPDTVFLLAAQVGRMVCEQSGATTLSTNVIGVHNVVQLCRRLRARLVFFSTSEVYGPGKTVMEETDADLQPANLYGLSKLFGERLIRHEVSRGTLDAIILRPFCIYTENEARGDHRSMMIRFAEHFARREPVDVHADTARGWLHVDDAVRAIEAAALHATDLIVNIGHPEIVETRVLAERIRTTLGAPTDVIRMVSPPTAITPRKYPCLDRMLALPDAAPRITIDEGLARVCAAVAPRPAAALGLS